jgi:hypothetical protein
MYPWYRLDGVLPVELIDILQKCLELWSSASDSIRITAFLAIRKLASATDESIMDNVLKVHSYLQQDANTSMFLNIALYDRELT